MINIRLTVMWNENNCTGYPTCIVEGTCNKVRATSTTMQYLVFDNRVS